MCSKLIHLTAFWLLCQLLVNRLSAQNFAIKFPDDIVENTCLPFEDWGQPIVVADSGLAIQLTYYFEGVDPVPDACYIIYRAWLIAVGDVEPATGPVVYVPNPAVSAIADSPLNLPGPTVSPAGTPAPYAPTLSKITPSDPTPTDYSTFWQGPDRYYHYTQRIRFLDITAPTLLDAIILAAPDSSDNDPELWNQPYWNNPLNGSHDLPEASAEIRLDLSDDCGGMTLQYWVFSDLDSDGVEESVNGPLVPFVPEGQVRYNNLNTPNYGGGELRIFDNAAPYANFGFTEMFFGDFTSFLLLPPPLPHGTHRLRWQIEDYCGNSLIESDTLILTSAFPVATTEPEAERLQVLPVQPNPFNDNVVLRYFLPGNGMVALVVFDPAGREIFSEKTLRAAGWHQQILDETVWKMVGPGVFFYRLETAHGIATGKLVRMK